MTNVIILALSLLTNWDGFSFVNTTKTNRVDMVGGDLIQLTTLGIEQGGTNRKIGTLTLYLSRVTNVTVSPEGSDYLDAKYKDWITNFGTNTRTPTPPTLIREFYADGFSK